MDEDRVTGTAKHVGGKVEEDFGRIARDTQAAGSGFTDIVQRTIEQQPYTAVAIAVAVGWLLGRTHRPI